jgi:hypothetical protein
MSNTLNDEKAIEEITQFLLSFMRNGGVLEAQADWMALALEEWNQRTRKILAGFSDETIAMLAEGSVHMGALIEAAEAYLSPDYICPSCKSPDGLHVSISAYAHLVQTQGKPPTVDVTDCDGGDPDIDPTAKMFCSACGHGGTVADFENN